jgi:hypothetical protein
MSAVTVSTTPGVILDATQLPDTFSGEAMKTAYIANDTGETVWIAATEDDGADPAGLGLPVRNGETLVLPLTNVGTLYGAAESDGLEIRVLVLDVP